MNDPTPLVLTDSMGGHASPATEGKNVIAISSGKGGVGKTWFAVTLCHALALASRKVLLFDGDLGLANVDIQLGLMPKFDLSSVLSGRRALADVITPYPEGSFDIIAGQSGSGNLATIANSRLASLRQALFAEARSYDHAVFDIGAGIDRTVRNLATGAGTNLVITTDEPTALTDAYAFIKVMATSGDAKSIRIVVNMASNERQGEHTYKTLLRACEQFLKFSPPLAGIVRRDPHVSDSIRHQTPTITRHPNSEAVLDVEAIANKIAAGP